MQHPRQNVSVLAQAADDFYNENDKVHKCLFNEFFVENSGTVNRVCS